MRLAGIIDTFPMIGHWRQPFCHRQTPAHVAARETQISKTGRPATSLPGRRWRIGPRSQQTESSHRRLIPKSRGWTAKNRSCLATLWTGLLLRAGRATKQQSLILSWNCGQSGQCPHPIWASTLTGPVEGGCTAPELGSCSVDLLCNDRRIRLPHGRGSALIASGGADVSTERNATLAGSTRCRHPRSG